jgi:hypothetical protein
MIIVVSALLGLIGAARISFAADDQPATAPTPTMFPKGAFALQLDAGAAGALDNRNEVLPMVQLGLNWYVANNVAIGFTLDGYYAIQDGPDAYIGGVSAILRHHFLQWGDRYSLFADVMGGVSYATEPTPFEPKQGTYFNFIFRSGLGATAKINDDMHLMMGLRYFHLSNGRVEGDLENPSINGIEGFAGVIWMLR